MKKKIALKLLFELVKNSKRSDRELAKILGVSQPTITRMRQELEKKAIKEYTAIPNWVELGYELMAFTFLSMIVPPDERQEEIRKAKDWVMKNPNIIFASSGDGMGKSGMCISFHKDYTSFANFITKCQTDWGKYLKDMQFFIVSMKGGVELKPFSFKYLEKVEEF
jgi:DNA-binding Lrp family transcriptional regulator